MTVSLYRRGIPATYNAPASSGYGKLTLTDRRKAASQVPQDVALPALLHAPSENEQVISICKQQYRGVVLKQMGPKGFLAIFVGKAPE